MTIAEIIGEDEYYYPGEIAEAIFKAASDDDPEEHTKEIEEMTDALYQLKAISENKYNSEYYRTLYKYLYKLASVTEF